MSVLLIRFIHMGGLAVLQPIAPAVIRDLLLS